MYTFVLKTGCFIVRNVFFLVAAHTKGICFELFNKWDIPSYVNM